MIDSFRGEYAFLSNFYPSPVEWDGVTYPTIEHAYQAAKTVTPLERLRLEGCSTPGKAKRLGKTVTMRVGWEDMKQSVMQDLIQQKFRNPKLRELLLATGDKMLVEGNDWGDTYWGVCNGKGHNWLGRILMGVRSAIQAGYC